MSVSGARRPLPEPFARLRVRHWVALAVLAAFLAVVVALLGGAA